MKITDRQICEDQLVTFKQSDTLMYQGLLFFNTINMCDRDQVHISENKQSMCVW